jgi:beta-lactamase regulating signal transducer with metallopeptidase domain
MSYLLSATESWVEPWSSAVWRASWQGSVLIALAWALLRRWKSISPRISCSIWRLICLKMLLAMAWLSPLPLPLLPAEPIVATVKQDVAGSVSALGNALPTKQPMVRGNGIASLTESANGISLRSVLMPLWLGGVFVCVVLTALRWNSVRRICASTLPCHSDALQEARRQEAARLGLARLPQLRCSAKAAGPMLVGIRHPTIIVPEDVESDFSASECRLMLAHELAHLRRRDLSWNWLATVVGWLMFFQPMIWLLKRCWLHAQEAACDELLIQNGNVTAAEYGRLLLKIATRWSRGPTTRWATAEILGDYRNLKGRIISMSYVHPKRSNPSVIVSVVVAIVVISAMIPWRLVAQQTNDRAPVVTSSDQDPKLGGKSTERLHPKPAQSDSEAAKANLAVQRAELLAIAMHNYHDVNHHFPPAVVMGPDGKTPHSWRVEILRYMGMDAIRSNQCAALYNQYRMTEPWDSPTNQKVLMQMPEVFRSPYDDPNSTNSGYYVLVGMGTVFEGKDGIKKRDISDGLNKTLLIVDAKRNTPWTKPEDIRFAPDQPNPALGGFVEGKFAAAMADGTARQFDRSEVENTLKWLIMRNDGHLIDSP